MYFYDSVPTGIGFRIMVVTKSELITGRVDKRTPWQRVIDDVRAGHDPLSTLKDVGAVERDVYRLCDLRFLEYHTDNLELKATFLDPLTRKEVRVVTNHTSINSRERAVAEMKAQCGIDFDQSVRRASIWHVGLDQFIIVAIALLIFGGIGVAIQLGTYDPQAVIDMPEPPRRRASAGLSRLIAHLCLLVGSDGMVAIGLAIAGASYVWFFNKWVKSPQRFSFTALNPPSETASLTPLQAMPPDVMGNLRCLRCLTGVAAKDVVDGSCRKCGWPLTPYSKEPQQVLSFPFRVTNAQHKYWILLPLLFLCPLIILLRAKTYPQPDVDNRVARVVILSAWGAGVAVALLYGAFRVPRGAWFSRTIRIKTFFTCRSIEWSEVRHIAWHSKKCDLRIYTHSGDEVAFDVSRRRDPEMRQLIRALINGDAIQWGRN